METPIQGLSVPVCSNELFLSHNWLENPSQVLSLDPYSFLTLGSHMWASFFLLAALNANSGGGIRQSQGRRRGPASAVALPMVGGMPDYSRRQ